MSACCVTDFYLSNLAAGEMLAGTAISARGSSWRVQSCLHHKYHNCLLANITPALGKIEFAQSVDGNQLSLCTMDGHTS